MFRRRFFPEKDPSAAALFTEMDSEAEAEATTATETTSATATEEDEDEKENNGGANNDAATSSSSASSLHLSAAAAEATCGICLELVAAAHAITSCGHCYCGPCLLCTIEASTSTVDECPRLPARCPQCRSLITAPPVRVRMLDKIVSAIAAELPEDEERASWRARMAHFESSTAAVDENENGNRRLPTAADAERIYATSFASRRPAPLRVTQNEGEEEEGDVDEGGDEGAADDSPPVAIAPRPAQRRRVEPALVIPDLREEALQFLQGEASRQLETAAGRIAQILRESAARAAAQRGGVP